MKNLKSILLFTFLLGLGQIVTAQKYFVYDGTDFSVMFKCNTDNTKVLDVQFSAKDSNGEWQWYKFEITDSYDFDDEEIAGFTFYCVDGAGNKYAVDYYSDEDYVTVHGLLSDGSYGTKWELKRRAEE
jgi:hypothetical protein